MGFNSAFKGLINTTGMTLLKIVAFSLRPALPRGLLFERGLTDSFTAFSFPALCSTHPSHLIVIYLIAVNNNLLGE